MQHSPLNFNLEKELKVSVSISILLDCKVPSLTKLQDRVDVRVDVLATTVYMICTCWIICVSSYISTLLSRMDRY